MITSSSLSQTLFYQSSLASEEFEASPMCRNAMRVLQYAHDTGGIPLTKANNNFHRKFVEWAAVEFDWPGYELEELYAVNKVINEPDFPPLFEMHSLLMETRLMRHYKARAVVTRTGKAMIGHHGELQCLRAGRQPTGRTFRQPAANPGRVDAAIRTEEVRRRWNSFLKSVVPN